MRKLISSSVEIITKKYLNLKKNKGSFKKMKDIKTLTRSDIVDKIALNTGLTRQQSVNIMESTINILIDGLAKRGLIKLSSFGSIQVLKKTKRIGRNPKTGKEVMIAPRKSLSFRASQTLKKRVSSLKKASLKEKK